MTYNVFGGTLNPTQVVLEGDRIPLLESHGRRWNRNAVFLMSSYQCVYIIIIIIIFFLPS